MKISTIALAALLALLLCGVAQAAPTSKIDGMITAVNAAAAPPAVTIAGKTKTVTLTITAATTLHVAGVPNPTVADLEVGAKAHAEYDASSMVARLINASVPHAHIDGTITAINAASTPPTVTITSATNTVTLKITPATTLHVAGVPNPTVADLDVGAQAHAEYDAASLVATKLDAQSLHAHATGVVVATDVPSGHVSLDLNGNGTADLTLTIDSDTKIQLGPAQLEPGDIPLLQGFLVTAKYDAASLVASEIHVEHVHVFDAHAVVTSVNAATRTLTLTSHGVAMDFVVPLGADIRLAGQPATLGDLLAGDTAHVHYVVNAGGTPIVLNVDVPGPKRQHADGSLTAVGTSDITVATKSGPVMLTLFGGTDLKLNGQPVTLAQLASALTAANAAHHTIHVHAEFIPRGSTNLALHVDAHGG